MEELHGRIIFATGAPAIREVEPGIRTLHGMHTNAFPNCFFLGSAETARCTPSYYNGGRITSGADVGEE
jgi:hypothetical protein